MAVDLSDELKTATAAIRAAGQVVMRLYSTFDRVENAPADISTEADKASQEVILQALHRAFPADGLCGEESTPTVSQGSTTSQRLWIVDPIDGTRGFAEKIDEFSIMIGLVAAGQVIMGLVLEPAIDRLTYACIGQGCFVQPSASSAPTSCRVTSTSQLTDAVLAVSRSQKAKGEARLIAGFGAQSVVRTYSAGVKLAQVARGETDVYLGDYLTLKDWDVCAGHILVIEAGGAVTSVDGDPIIYDGTGKSLHGRGILSTNAILHSQCLEVLRSGRYTFG